MNLRRVSHRVLFAFAISLPGLSTSQAVPAFGLPQRLNTTAIGDVGFDSQPVIASDGQGGWLAVWASNEDVSGGAGTDADLFFTRSPKGQPFWTFPRTLNGNAPGDTGSDFRPALATDGNGHWIAVWDSNEDVGGVGTDRDILHARSADNGATWSAPLPIDPMATTDSGHDANATICVGPSGHWLVLWESDDARGGTLGTDQDILAVTSTDNGASWSAAIPVNSGATSDDRSDFLPSVDCSANGIVMAAWSSSGDSISNVETTMSADQGQTWTPSIGVFASPVPEQGEDFGPMVRIGHLPGEWMIAWESGNPLNNTIGDDQDILSSFSSDDGAAWTAPRPVNTNASGDDALDLSPSIVSMRSGTRHIWAVAWSSETNLSGTGTDADIWFSYALDNGQTWSSPTPLPGFASTDLINDADLEPSLATDGNGQWFLAWSSSHNLGGVSGSDADVFVLISTKDFFWNFTEALNDNAAADLGADFRPSTATDAQGKVVSVWFSNENLNGTAGTDQDIFVAVSEDGGALWGPTTVLNTNAAADTGTDRDPRVVFVGNNTWLAAWSSSENLGGTLGTDSDILFSRSTDGGVTWSAPAPLNSTAASDNGGGVSDGEPFLTSDAKGNVVAVWSISGAFGADFDIAWARSTDAGVTWSAVAPMNPEATIDNADEFGMTVQTSGQGTWIAAWVSNSASGGIGATLGDDDDLIYRVSTNDGATWSSGAVLNPRAAIDGAEDDDFEPRLAADGQNTWIATWYLEASLENTPMDDHDVLVSRSTDDGGSWGLDQSLNNRLGETADDLFPWIDTNGSGHWIVVWTADDTHFGGNPFESKILYACSDDDGISWSAPATLNATASTETSSHFSPTVLFTGSAALAAWAGADPPPETDILYTTVPLPLAGNSVYRTWIATFYDLSLSPSLWGTDADPEADRLVNLIEFFMALDPTQFDNHLAPTAVRKGNTVSFNYRRNKDAVGHTTGTAEWSEDLSTWKVSGQQRANGNTVTLTQVSVVDAGDHDVITVETTAAFPLFLRLRVRLH